MKALFQWMVSMVLIVSLFCGCSNGFPDEQSSSEESPEPESGRGGGLEPLSVNAGTGIPYASVFQYPIRGMGRTWIGFGFGAYNDAFPGRGHLGADTKTWLTRYGTPVVAPADGIVRITTDIRFGSYGSDSTSNPDNLGCVIVLESLLPNGQAVMTLLGHVLCESGVYDPDHEVGNPTVGTIVRRGQYVGHVGHYWHGAGYTTDWPHVHFGILRGSFSASGYTRSDLARYVQGYDSISNFTTDASGSLHHTSWLDPVEFVEGHGDPIQFANGNVLHHPSGSLLQDGTGAYWIVSSDTEISRLSQDVITSDRYDTSLAVRVSDDEIGCYFQAAPISSVGEVMLYRRPLTNSIVIAYEHTGARCDIILWEALISWGFTAEDINPSYADAMWREWFYNPEPDLRLRPGTLVKGDAETEVSIVTWQNTRLPIQSGELFEGLGFQWDRIVTIPQDVLDEVAGPREDRVFSREDVVSCPALPTCENGATCGGGVEPEPDPEPDPVVDPPNSEPEPDPVVDPDPEPEDPVEDPPDPEPFCEPSSISECACASGETGTQTCLLDGSAYEGCQCPDPVESDPVEPDPEPDPVVDPPVPDPEPDPVCIPNAQLSCDCGNGVSGIHVCLPDASGFGDCVCPDPVEPDPEPEPDPVIDPPDPEPDPVVDPPVSDPEPDPPIILYYEGPVTGEMVLMAWWQNPDGSNRGWDVVSECADTDPTDTVLVCELPVPSGSYLFEFQINLPNGQYWGDHSCSSGGCDAPVGNLTLSKGSVPVEYVFTPNPSGAPYYNGYLAPVP